MAEKVTMEVLVVRAVVAVRVQSVATIRVQIMAGMVAVQAVMYITAHFLSIQILLM